VITIFPKLVDPKKKQYAELTKVLQGIRSGEVLKKATQAVRAAGPEERDNQKKQLPVALFSGKFSERRAAALEEYSYLICLDFDDVAPTRLVELKANDYIRAVWTSPSGTGLKALVQVGTTNHLGHALALIQEFPDVDKNAIKDVGRACFLSHDPDLFENHHSAIFTKVVLGVVTDEQKYENLIKWVTKDSQFVEGNRNNFIAKLAGAANRFGIPSEFLLKKIEENFVQEGFPLREAQGVVRSLYENHRDVWATVDANQIWTNETIKEVLSTEIETREVITAGDVEEDLLTDYDVGTKGGDTTYFPALDEIFRFMRGEQTTVTGVSSAGKSTMLNHLLLVRACFTGEKVGILSMEQYPPVVFYRELIRQIIGKPLERESYDRMTRAEYTRGLEWVKNHFYFIYPESSDPTPEWTLGRFQECVIRYGVSTVVVDPHNSQSHDYKSAGGRDDRYIGPMLRKNQRFALQNGIHFFNVAHPRGIGKDDKGYYREPSSDEISGGPVWWQVSDNILVHHRPSLPLDYGDPKCTLRSTKIKKQPMNGRPGVCEFTFDWRSGRFYIDGYNPLNDFKL
jgi:hypothetical protein